MYTVTLFTLPANPNEQPTPKVAVLSKEDMLDVISTKLDENHYAVVSLAQSDKSVFDD